MFINSLTIHFEYDDIGVFCTFSHSYTIPEVQLKLNSRIQLFLITMHALVYKKHLESNVNSWKDN